MGVLALLSGGLAISSGGKTDIYAGLTAPDPLGVCKVPR